MFAILCAFIVVFAAYVVGFYKKVLKYPPGPRPWPLVGNLLELPAENMHTHITKMKEKYGPVYTVWQPEPIVYLQDYEHVKDALVTHGDDYTGRPTDVTENFIQNVENGGIIMSQGDQWRQDRRACLSILRDFGMGKNVRLSARECVEHIRSLPNKNCDIHWPLQLLVGNVINRLLFSFDYKHNDCNRLKQFCDTLDRLNIEPRQNPLIGLGLKFSWLKTLPVVGYHISGKFLDIRDQLYDHITTDIERTLKDYDIDQEPENFTQAFVQKMKRAGTFSFDRLKNVCFDFFMAGSETTSTTLRWACILFAQYPQIQEINEKLGDRFPSMTDRPNMPYTSATVMELQRYANILPFNVPHRTTVDTVCGDFKIPADTEVQAMINTVMAEDPHFENPEVFNPERFLEKDGKTFKKKLVERIIPFSMGKRLCAGEALARMELFLGLVSLVQNFRIQPPLDAPLKTKPIYAFIVLPPDNNFVIECL